MKKYFCEADKHLHEKPTEPLHLFVTTAKTWVLADDEEEALVLAADKLADKYQGSGILLGRPRITKVTELPANWSYGYGEDNKVAPQNPGELLADAVIK